MVQSSCARWVTWVRACAQSGVVLSSLTLVLRSKTAVIDSGLQVNLVTQIPSKTLQLTSVTYPPLRFIRWCPLHFWMCPTPATSLCRICHTEFSLLALAGQDGLGSRWDPT